MLSSRARCACDPIRIGLFPRRRGIALQVWVLRLRVRKEIPQATAALGMTRCYISGLGKALQRPGGDHEALNLAGAFVNFGDARVAIVALDGVFAAVAI